MPHIKTFMRVSPDFTQLAWFLITRCVPHCYTFLSIPKVELTHPFSLQPERQQQHYGCIYGSLTQKKFDLMARVDVLAENSCLKLDC